MKKSYKILLVITVVIVLLVTTVALLISPIAKRYIEKHSPELVGRHVTMDKLCINLFTGRINVSELKMTDAEDSTVFFSLGNFELKMRLLPLLSHRVIINKIALTNPDVKIYQRGNEFNFDGILAMFPTDKTQVKSGHSKHLEIGLYDISITGGQISYKDLLLDATWGLNDLNLHIPGVYFAGEKTDVGAVLNFADGGSLETTIAYNVETSDYDIGIKLKELALAGTLPYFRQLLTIGHVNGLLSADMHIRGNRNHLLDLRTSGTATLSGFAMHDMDNTAVLTVDTLHIDLAEGALQPMSYRFNRIYAAGISSLVELRNDGSSNLSSLMKNDSSLPSSEEASGPVKLYVADLEIRRSGIILRDLAPEKPFEYLISDIRMKSRNFDPDVRNRLTIDARMQKTGLAKLVWDGSLTDINNQNITLVLSNLNLRDFTPYSEHYTAYPLIKGNLSFRSQNVIRNRNLDGTNHLDVFEPQVDKKRKDIKPELNIPLKLGLYVLKDKKGHVKMDLPVKGNLDSPEFSYRKIVLKAIGNVLLKVVTAPFSFLSGHNDNIEYIDIEPLQYAFSSEQYASLDKLAQVLKDKPELKITLTQHLDYPKALLALAKNNLRMAYNNRQMRDSTGARPVFSMLEYEKIQSLNFKSDSVAVFADSLLRSRGVDPIGLNPSAKALALYAKPAKNQLVRVMALRDSALVEYMSSTHALTSANFCVQEVDTTAMQVYVGRDRYTIGLGVDGETVEATQEEPDVATKNGDAAGPASQRVASTPQQHLRLPTRQHNRPDVKDRNDTSGNAVNSRTQ